MTSSSIFGPTGSGSTVCLTVCLSIAHPHTTEKATIAPRHTRSRHFDTRFSKERLPISGRHLPPPREADVNSPLTTVCENLTIAHPERRRQQHRPPARGGYEGAEPFLCQVEEVTDAVIRYRPWNRWRTYRSAFIKVTGRKHRCHIFTLSAGAPFWQGRASA